MELPNLRNKKKEEASQSIKERKNNVENYRNLFPEKEYGSQKKFLGFLSKYYIKFYSIWIKEDFSRKE